MISCVSADDIFTNNDDYEEVTDEYEFEDESIDDSLEEKNDNIESLDKKIEKKKSFSVVLIEIFCCVVGFFMLFLAFRANES